MLESDFFREFPVTKVAKLNCPFCKTWDDYELKWLSRRKLEDAPRYAGAADVAMFGKMQSYLVLIDDFADCHTCRKRFEISGIKTTAFC